LNVQVSVKIDILQVIHGKVLVEVDEVVVVETHVVMVHRFWDVATLLNKPGTRVIILIN
jgi:hypothetical protein